MTTKKRILTSGVALLALAVVGLAYAAWTTSGSGSGTAKAKNAQALTTVDVSATTTATLYPGATGDVLLKTSNPNDYPVRVTDVKGNGAITATGGSGTCTTTGVTFTDQTGKSIDIPAKGSTEATMTGAAAMSNLSEDGCQGATFTIPVSLSGTSNAS